MKRFKGLQQKYRTWHRDRLVKKMNGSFYAHCAEDVKAGDVVKLHGDGLLYNVQRKPTISVPVTKVGLSAQQLAYIQMTAEPDWPTCRPVVVKGLCAGAVKDGSALAWGDGRFEAIDGIDQAIKKHYKEKKEIEK